MYSINLVFLLHLFNHSLDTHTGLTMISEVESFAFGSAIFRLSRSYAPIRNFLVCSISSFFYIQHRCRAFSAANSHKQKDINLFSAQDIFQYFLCTRCPNRLSACLNVLFQRGSIDAGQV